MLIKRFAIQNGINYNNHIEYCNIYISKANDDNRSIDHNTRLSKNYHIIIKGRTYIRKHSIKYSVPIVWNPLKANITTCKTIGQIKNKFKDNLILTCNTFWIENSIYLILAHVIIFAYFFIKIKNFIAT